MVSFLNAVVSCRSPPKALPPPAVFTPGLSMQNQQLTS